MSDVENQRHRVIMSTGQIGFEAIRVEEKKD